MNYDGCQSHMINNLAHSARQLTNSKDNHMASYNLQIMPRSELMFSFHSVTVFDATDVLPRSGMFRTAERCMAG